MRGRLWPPALRTYPVDHLTTFPTARAPSRLLVTVAAGLVLSCAAVPRAAPPRLVLVAGSEDVIGWQLPPFEEPRFERVTNTRDREDLTKLVGVATDLAKTPDFRTVLAALPALDTGTAATPEESGTNAARVFLGLQSGKRMLPVSYTVVGDSWLKNETARTGITARPYSAGLLLHEVVLKRFREGTAESIACALNTVIHEWTHAIPESDGSTASLYQDRSHQETGGPLVSYTFGSVAQCVYLQLHGYPSLRMAECIEAAGTRGFVKNTCDARWLKGTH